ncbi:MAG: hypothetical protein V2A73_17645 [Pseudomonadota bacterium]
MTINIKPVHSQPRFSDGNGAIERFHNMIKTTIVTEILSTREFTTLDELTACVHHAWLIYRQGGRLLTRGGSK